MSGRARGGGGFVRRDALHQWTMRFGPNMTPMVDIVMVILIFFMASAAFMGQEWFLRAVIPVEAVPGAGAGATQTWDLPVLRIDVVLDVDAGGRTTASCAALQADGQPLEAVIERLGAFSRDEDTESLQVLIKPTSRVPYRDVVRVHEACEAAGIARVGIGVSREGAPPARP